MAPLIKNTKPATDEAHIRRTIETYMFGVDAKDRDALSSCFSPQAEARYHSGTEDEYLAVGGEAIASRIYESCRRFSASNHSISNFVTDVQGAIATSNTFAVAHVVIGEKGLIRGLRYEDTLHRSESGWVIARRVHTPLWQTEVTVETPRFFR